jgi:hypothetical protein
MNIFLLGMSTWRVTIDNNLNLTISPNQHRKLQIDELKVEMIWQEDGAKVTMDLFERGFALTMLLPPGLHMGLGDHTVRVELVR